MEREKFYYELKEVLGAKNDINEETYLNLTSLTTLGLIVFLDENFGKQISSSDLKKAEKVADLILLIGLDRIE